MSKMIVIRHPRTGQEYAILPADFTRATVHPKGAGSYSDQGYIIDRYEDGTSFDGPKSKREIDKAAEQRQAAREERQQPKAPAEKAKG